MRNCKKVKGVGNVVNVDERTNRIIIKGDGNFVGTCTSVHQRASEEKEPQKTSFWSRLFKRKK